MPPKEVREGKKSGVLEKGASRLPPHLFLRVHHALALLCSLRQKLQIDDNSLEPTLPCQQKGNITSQRDMTETVLPPLCRRCRRRNFQRRHVNCACRHRPLHYRWHRTSRTGGALPVIIAAQHYLGIHISSRRYLPRQMPSVL